MGTRILVGIDRSNAAERALAWLEPVRTCAVHHAFVGSVALKVTAHAAVPALIAKVPR